MRKFKLTIIVCLIMVLFCPLFFASCTGLSGDFGGGQGGSSGGSGESEGGSEQSKDYGSPKSSNIDDYYESLLVLTDATPDGEFYDEISQSNMTFKDLLRRQITAFSEHLVFALSELYGDSTVGSKQLTNYPTTITTLNILGADHAKGCGYSGSYLNVTCPKCQLIIAGLDSTIVQQQLNYNNAILGGYLYEVKKVADENGNGQEGEFSTTLNSGQAWLNASALNVESLKLEISKILVSEGDNTTAFETNLENIDHLGFTDYDIAQIKAYILDKIIGTSRVAFDNNLYQTYFKNSPMVMTTTNNADQFTSNINLHYFKAYEMNLQFIIDVALTMSTEGIQRVDENGKYNGSTSAIYKLYSDVLPRINVEVLKLSEISEKINGKWDEETGSIIGGSSMDNPTPVLDDPKKLVSLIFVPMMNKKMIEDFRKELSDDVASWYNCNEFGLGSMNIGLKNDNSSTVFVKTKFYVNIDGLEEPFDDYVENSSYDENGKSGAFASEFETKLEKGKYDPQNDLASYNISGALEEKYGKKVKISDFKGLSMFNANGELNDKFFMNGKLKVQSTVFNVVGKTDENGQAIAGTNAVFNADSNFFQVNFEYYNEANESISPVELYLMYISNWPD